MKLSNISFLLFICLSPGVQGCSSGGLLETPTALQSSPSGYPSLGDVSVRASDGMEMVYVPPGEFEMGSDYEQTAFARGLCRKYYGRDAVAACQAASFGDESPAHLVSLGGFWLDKTEVTNGQYRKCAQAGGCTAPAQSSSYYRPSYYRDPAYSGYPVIWVTRAQAQHYCIWAGGRLPTEAEWEYAARGPESRLFPWGNRFEGTRLNYCDAGCDAGPNDSSFHDGYADTAPAGSFPAGASWVDALDMAGNVREWVSDWYGYYTATPQVNPTGPPSGEGVIPHGGSWLDLPVLTRSANRGGDPPDYSRHNVGFRCVMDYRARHVTNADTFAAVLKRAGERAYIH